MQRLHLIMGSSSKVEMNEVKEDERPHVMVVDDNVVDRRIAERLFTNSAWKGIWFHNLLALNVYRFHYIKYACLKTIGTRLY